MLKIVTNLKDDVAGMLSGIDLRNVDNLNGALERAANVMTMKAYVPEANAKQLITLYSGVYDYACDQRMYGTKIRDVKPLGAQRDVLDYVYKKAEDEFDRTKQTLSNGTNVAFDSTDGVPVIRIVSAEVKQKVILDQMNAITGWTASGNASSPILDSSFFYDKGGAIRFNLTAAASPAELSKTMSSPLDLSSYLGVGVAFLAIEMPSTVGITSIGIRYGSDASNYYEITNTVNTLGAFIANDFQLIQFDSTLATITGSPDISKIQYLQVFINNAGTAMSNVRIGGLWMSFPYPAQIYFQTSAIFKALGATTSSSITTDDDQIILNLPAYTIYQHEAAIAVLQQSGGATADSAITNLNEILHGVHTGNNSLVKQGLYDFYRGDNPSQELRTIGNYYD